MKGAQQRIGIYYGQLCQFFFIFYLIFTLSVMFDIDTFLEIFQAPQTKFFKSK